MALVRGCGDEFISQEFDIPIEELAVLTQAFLYGIHVRYSS